MSSVHRPAVYVQEHATPQGEGDARPTALQIVQDEGLVGKLAGQVVLITGCSSGIGVETARAIHASGADTYITARDLDKTQAVLDDIRRSNPDSKGKLEIIRMELDKLSSVRAGAADFLKRSGGQLNTLICNAGVMACPCSKTTDGIETQFGVCHVAHFLLFQLVKPALLSSGSAACPSRVVTVSSVGHRGGPVRLNDYNFGDGKAYHEGTGYAQAKTANIWMANEIERRYGSKHLHATSLMPGGIHTSLQRHMSDDARKALEGSPTWQKHFKNVQQGAATTVWAAIGKEWSNKGGVYLEDCAQALPVEAGKEDDYSIPGYAAHAYDADGARGLWELSLKLVGLPDTDAPAGGLLLTRAVDRECMAGPSAWFTGAVEVNMVHRPQSPSCTSCAHVRFSSGARTAWHSHPLGQLLLVTEGEGYVQAAGGVVQLLRVGDSVWTPPGVVHWHGAAPHSAMRHTAIQEADATGSNVTWMHHVDDDTYTSAAAAQNQNM